MPTAYTAMFVSTKRITVVQFVARQVLRGINSPSPRAYLRDYLTQSFLGVTRCFLWEAVQKFPDQRGDRRSALASPLFGEQISFVVYRDGDFFSLLHNS